MDTKMTADKKTTPFFSLRDSNDSFTSRCKDVFSGLETLEKKHDAYEQINSESKRAEQDVLMKTDPDDSSARFDGKHDHDAAYNKNHKRGRQAQYDRAKNWKRAHRSNNCRRDSDGFYPPLQRPPRRFHKNVPDHKKHPEKWTRYSLEDVESSDMSEKSNQRAAFDFLSERRRAREKKKEEEKFEVGETACSKGVISFSRPKSSARNISHKNATSSSSSSSVPFSEEENDDEDQLVLDKRLCLEKTEADSNKFSKDNEADKCFLETDHGSDKMLSFKARKNIRRNIRHKEDETEDAV